MLYRPLGNTDVDIPAIGMGAMGFGGFYSRDTSDDRESVRLLRLAFDLGMTFVDTAEIYGSGHSEELIGQAVHGIRDRIFIASKFSPETSDFDGVMAAADRTLRRLDTDRIDLYQIHWPNLKTPLEETVRALDTLVGDGKVRFIGVSNFSPGETRKVLDSLHSGLLVSMQQEYSLQERTVEHAALPFCKENGLTLFGYSPLAQGRIADHDARFDVLTDVAQEYGMTVAQVALQWLAQDSSTCVLVKAANEAHLRENAAALDTTISAAALARIAEAYRMEIEFLPTDQIEVESDPTRPSYTNLADAEANTLRLSPSPRELADQMVSTGDMLKPVKVVPTAQGKGFQLTEGKLRYWAWVIAHGGQKPIPSIVQSQP